MQRPPRLTGWSGLPSSLTTRPSRLRARTPQPAGHSRHTVANHAATPGTSCSLGTTSGRMVSVACWQPPAAAAAPVPATILKKSRRFTPDSPRLASSLEALRLALPPRLASSLEALRLALPPSVVARDAIERSVRIVRGVVLAVAVDAPAHAQRRRCGTEAGHVEQIIRERRTGACRHGGHRLHGAVARLARHTELHVRLVRKVRELRQLVDARPGDRLAPGAVFRELLDVRLVGGDDLVTAETALHGRQARVFRAARVGVTVLAV